MGEHNAEGALGVVLNRPAKVKVADAVTPLASLVAPDDLLYLGGPVRPEVPVLLVDLSDPDLADIRVFGSIGFLVGEVSEESRAAIRKARVFAGYSGWGPGQLEAEMKGGSWIVEPAREEDVFSADPESLWSQVLERKGGIYRRLSSMPYDPSMN